MMADRDFTIIIVPRSDRPVTKLHISHRIFSYAILGLAFMVLTGLGMMIHYVRLNAQARDYEKLKRENVQLQTNLQQSQRLTQKLNRKISSLAKLSAQLKAAAGLPKFASRKFHNPRMGVGGVRMDGVHNAAELQALEKRAEELEKSLISLNSYFQEYRPFTTPSIIPTDGIVSSSFGSRSNPFSGKPDFHEGLDISNSIGTAVFAPADGVVTFGGYKGTLGLTLQIRHDEEITTHYGHLSILLVKEGNRVKRGQRIALMGNSGMSTGAHLHFEIRVNDQPVNPGAYITKQDRLAGNFR